MNIALTSAELTVFAEHFDVDPSFAVGKRTDDELSALREEGWRSLLARGFARHEGAMPELASPVAQVAIDAVAPLALVTYSRVWTDRVETTLVLIGRQAVWSTALLGDGVFSYAELDLEEAISILAAPVSETEDVACRLEVIGSAERQVNGVLAWATGPEGRYVRLAGEDVIPSSSKEIESLISDMVEGISRDLPTQQVETQ